MILLILQEKVLLKVYVTYYQISNINYMIKRSGTNTKTD